MTNTKCTSFPSRLVRNGLIVMQIAKSVGGLRRPREKSLGTVLFASMNALDTLGYGCSNHTWLLLPIFTVPLLFLLMLWDMRIFNLDWLRSALVWLASLSN
jgi:hypothetical protein